MKNDDKIVYEAVEREDMRLEFNIPCGLGDGVVPAF
jgi:hypothetical protein